MTDAIQEKKLKISVLRSQMNEKLEMLLGAITELSPANLKLLVSSQDQQTEYPFEFSPDIVRAFKTTPRKILWFFRNPHHARALVQTKKAVRLQIRASDSFFKEQKEIQKLEKEVRALTVQQKPKDFSESKKTSLKLRKTATPFKSTKTPRSKTSSTENGLSTCMSSGLDAVDDIADAMIVSDLIEVASPAINAAVDVASGLASGLFD